MSRFSNSDLGIDFIKMILNHLFRSTEALRDFVIPQSLRNHFDNTEFVSARLLEKCVSGQQVPKLGFQVLQFELASRCDVILLKRVHKGRARSLLTVGRQFRSDLSFAKRELLRVSRVPFSKPVTAS